MWPWFPSGNIAPMFCVRYSRFVIKTQILPIIKDSYCKESTVIAAEKTWLEQHFLKEFKATCKNSSESELKQQKATWKVIWVSDAFNPSIIKFVLKDPCSELRKLKRLSRLEQDSNPWDTNTVIIATVLSSKFCMYAIFYFHSSVINMTEGSSSRKVLFCYIKLD